MSADQPALAGVVLQDPDGVRGVLIGPADRLAEVIRPEAVVSSVMSDEDAVVEVGWVARHALCVARGDASDLEVLEYFTRKAALLEHIASTQVGEQRRATHELAAQARAEVAARTAPSMTLGEQLSAIGDDLDAAGAAWVAAGYPYAGPEYEAREAVFARLRAWNAAAAVVVS